MAIAKHRNASLTGSAAYEFRFAKPRQFAGLLEEGAPNLMA
jgi:hypothetical protein